MLSKLPMRQGVGIIVLNQNNQVFVAKRKDNPIDKWQMPQGGIDNNETPFNAMKRELAEETGGCVSDSLEMARFGAHHPAKTLLVAGVQFMGESAKILSPEKRVIMPTLEATCSLDLGCPIDAFSAFCDQHPDRKVVVYANTSTAGFTY